MGEIRVKTADGWSTKPAHKKTSTGWQDIPTHTMTANGWQGELTSQSPLRFRADGEMLDWRIDGKTSGNLFDISTDLVTHLGFSSTSGGIISIKSTNNAIGFYVKCQPDKYYTLSRATNTNNRFSIGFTADEPVDGTPLLSYTPFETSDTSVTALSPSNANYICAYLTNQYDPITDDLRLMLNEGSTALPYEPYGGVGDWDETTQRYRIPVRVEGENLFDGELEQGSLNSNDGSEVVNNTRVRTVGNTLLKEGTYTINCAGATGGVVVCAYNTDDLSYDKAASYVGQWRSLPFTFVVDNERLYRFAFKKANDSVIVPSEITDIQLLEGAYTADTLPPYEVSIYTDHQLMDGDSIDYTTTETTIPLETGNNTLTVDTAVQPSKVFVKFEG